MYKFNIKSKTSVVSNEWKVDAIITRGTIKNQKYKKVN